MDRRDFLKLAASAALLPLPANGGPEIAFTFDDPSTNSSANLTWQQINQRLLATLAQHQLSAALFICGKRVDSAAGRDLVASWNTAGHLIANHSYSHFYFPDTPLPDFEADSIKNEPLIRDYSHFVRLYRYPFFKEGDTAAKRDGMRSFLASHDYRIGRATIDASDWAIDARLAKRAATSSAADLTPYRDFYLQHIWERATYYDSLAQRLSLSPVRHTVVLHQNALNALFFGDVVVMFQKNGWKPVSADYAYRDPIYSRQPATLPAGESLIWALAKESGKFDKELRYPGEDDVYENPKMDALGL